MSEGKVPGAAGVETDRVPAVFPRVVLGDPKSFRVTVDPTGMTLEERRAALRQLAENWGVPLPLE